MAKNANIHNDLENVIGAAGGDIPVAGGDLPVADEDDLEGAPEMPDFDLFADDNPPVAGGDLPVAGGDLPIAGGDLPIAGGDLPVAGGDLPVVMPVAGGDLPIAGDDLPVGGGYNFIKLTPGTIVRFSGDSGETIFSINIASIIKFKNTMSEISIKTPDDEISLNWNVDIAGLLGPYEDM
jgi:hypothetical protein